MIDGLRPYPETKATGLAWLPAIPAHWKLHRAKRSFREVDDRSVNDHWGNIAWSDGDRVRRLIAEEIPQKVAVDPAYQNARKYSDKQNARIEHDEALRRVIVGLMKDDTDLFRLFSDNPDFKRWLGDTVFGMTYRQPPT